MTSRCLAEVSHASPVFGERDALRAALGELSTGWPAIVLLGHQISLVLPWDAVGYRDVRRLVDLPLTPALQYPSDADLDQVLASMGSAEFVVVRDAEQPFAVASRRAIVEAVAGGLRVAGDTSSPVQDVVEQLPEGVVVLDSDRNVLHANASGQQMIEALGNWRPGDRLSHLGGVPVETLIEDARVGTPRDVVTEPPAQHTFSVRTLRPTTARSDMVLIVRDVTHVRHRQVREATQERMALLGNLAGSIAHDFNNVLTVIMGQASLLQGNFREGDPREQNVRAIQEASQQASKLVRQLLAFSRRELAAPVVLDVRAVLVELESLMTRLVGEQIRIDLDVPPILWPIHADPVQIERVIANLVVNARDAMPKGGTLTIQAENVEACTCFPGAEVPSRAVRIRVSDTGNGMDTTTLARVFEPYFTTQPDKGTGIGLATVQATISALGGRITVDSRLGQGTTFEVTLRAVEGSPVATATPRLCRVPCHSGGQILLVEDDPALLDVVLRTLTHCGYEVVAARDAVSAFDMLHAMGAPDLLLTDVNLGHSKSGIELAHELRERYPGLRVLYMSGYAQEALLADAGHFQVDFIAKPFSGEELMQMVARLVGVPDDTGG